MLFRSELIPGADYESVINFASDSFSREEILKLYVTGEILNLNSEVNTAGGLSKLSNRIKEYPEQQFENMAKEFINLSDIAEKEILKPGQLVTVITDFYEESPQDQSISNEPVSMTGYKKIIKIYVGEIGVILNTDKTVIRAENKQFNKYQIADYEALIYFDKQSLY